jgi:plastocyanin
MITLSAFLPARAARADCRYERAGWSAELATFFHDVSGTVTIIDERTLYVENFTFDGGGPLVYFYLGETDANASYINGLAVEPLLSGTVYSGESLTLTLPPGETMDGYGAISVWCADVNVNFGSGAFTAPPGPPYPRGGWVSELSTLAHQVSGNVTIINERLLFVQDFTYDGGGPAVYFYLGATDANPSFANGLALDPLLSGTAANGDSLVLALPTGDTLDGWGAISVWCADFAVNFGSGPFLPVEVPGDWDGDCAITLADYGPFEACLAGPGVPYDEDGVNIVDVSVGPGFTFSPADVQIELDDTVHWFWAGGFHNVESGVGGVHDGNFRSGNATSDTNTTFDVRFDSTYLADHPMPGNVYPYYCIIHVGGGMVGSVTVQIPPCRTFDFDLDGDVDLDDFASYQIGFEGG